MAQRIADLFNGGVEEDGNSVITSFFEESEGDHQPDDDASESESEDEYYQNNPPEFGKLSLLFIFLNIMIRVIILTLILLSS